MGLTDYQRKLITVGGGRDARLISHERHVIQSSRRCPVRRPVAGDLRLLPSGNIEITGRGSLGLLR